MENRFGGVLEEIDRCRKGLAAYVLVVFALAGLSFLRAEEILRRSAGLLNRPLVAYDPSEAFFAELSIALYCGIALSLPVAAGLLWNGVVAKRVPAWRRWGWLGILLATLLFLAGALLGVRVLLPAGIRFLAGFETEDFRALISARRFISFCGTILLAIGIAFEAPLVSYLLARIGWLRPAFFRNRWRQAILVCTVIAAVITPTPDVYNLTLMTIPLLALFFVSFVVVWIVDRGRDGKSPT